MVRAPAGDVAPAFLTNKQTATLLRTFGARVHGVEGRVGALESRLEVVESKLA